MKIFISWSGDRSKKIAEALSQFFVDTIHYFKPWMSSNIEKGTRWSVDLLDQLEDTNIGIVCLTRENIYEPWIMFESGAIGKALKKSRVCTLLYNLKPAEIEGPLLQFQATQVTHRNDMYKLLHSLNEALPDDQKREKDQVDRSFNRWWPDLKREIDTVPDADTTQQNIRSDRELLEELIHLSRLQINKSNISFTDFFQGEDVRLFLHYLKIEKSEQETSNNWFKETTNDQYTSIAGDWFSRWNGGTSRGSWRTGTATVLKTGNYVLLWHREDYTDSHPYVIISKHEGENRLIGRYINLLFPSDSSPWLGLIINNKRIDGYWSKGKWDFRR